MSGIFNESAKSSPKDRQRETQRREILLCFIIIQFYAWKNIVMFSCIEHCKYFTD